MTAHRGEVQVRTEPVLDRVRAYIDRLPRRRWGIADRYLADVVAIGLLLAIAVVYTAAIVVPVEAFIRGDWPSFFFPNYALLGDRLREFDIPGWNPSQFSGTPFVGDPSSGWGYLPEMLLYSLLPPEAATVAFIGVHIAMAAVVTYVLARLLGQSVAGSFVAGSAYSLAWVAIATSSMSPWFGVTIGLLVSMVATELAIHTNSWSRRLWAWLLGGIGISQILAAWLGQGSYYALLVIGAWVVYRTLVIPTGTSSPSARVQNALLTGAGVLGTGFALGAAGILPRLDAIARSNLAGGVYVGHSAGVDRLSALTAPGRVREVRGGYTGAQWWYAGAAATTLALMAPIVARRWQPVWFFALVALGSLLLALTETTPLHIALNTALPFFERLHEHFRERILILYPPAVALLAGAFVTYLPKQKNAPILLLAAAAIPLFAATACGVLPDLTGLLSRETLAIIIATSTLTVFYALLTNSLSRWGVLLALIILVLWDPGGRIMLRGFVDESRLAHSLRGSLAQDADAFLHANGAATYVATATQSSPGRYAGYDPTHLEDARETGTNAPRPGYRNALKASYANSLLVVNWATWFGLEDVQGYSPTQIQRYVEYIDALNGHRQEYHERDIFPGGITSPLLDLLNLRYLIVPGDAPERSDFDSLLATMPTIYEDEYVRILENLDAFPRAWLVHEARQVTPGEALSLLADGAVDARRTALLETAPPPLETPAGPDAENVTFGQLEPDRIALRVAAQAPALLMMSEIWDPGWSATVDGAPAPVLIADHVLRAVPVPAGEHQVVLSYTPPLLRLGMAISLATMVLLAGAAIWLGARGNYRAKPDSGEER